MKPRLIDKILLGLLLLIFIAAMVFCFLVMIGVVPMSEVTRVMNDASDPDKTSVYARIGIAAGAAILALVGLKLLFTGGKPKEKETSNNASLLKSDENGVAYISAASIDSMAQKYVKANSRIRECTSKVEVAPDSTVSLTLKAIVLADTNIPELCDTVRRELKEYIETYAGVKVERIAFMVVNTYSPVTAARVN